MTARFKKGSTVQPGRFMPGRWRYPKLGRYGFRRAHLSLPAACARCGHHRRNHLNSGCLRGPHGCDCGFFVQVLS